MAKVFVVPRTAGVVEQQRRDHALRVDVPFQSKILSLGFGAHTAAHGEHFVRCWSENGQYEQVRVYDKDENLLAGKNLVPEEQ